MKSVGEVNATAILKQIEAVPAMPEQPSKGLTGLWYSHDARTILLVDGNKHITSVTVTDTDEFKFREDGWLCVRSAKSTNEKDWQAVGTFRNGKLVWHYGDYAYVYDKKAAN